MNNDILQTPEFRGVLIRTLLDIPEKWSSQYWHDSSGIEQKAIQRLSDAGLAEFCIDIQCTVSGGFLRKSRVVKKCFHCSGQNAFHVAAQKMNQHGVEATFGLEMFDVRLSDEGSVARDTFRFDDDFMKARTVEFALTANGITKVHEVDFRAYVKPGNTAATSSQAIAAAQANASIGDIVIHNHIEASNEQRTSGTHENSAGPESQPKAILTSWREITDALNMEHSEQSKVKSLNERYEGPIPNPGKGSQPIVEKSVLISWWNRLAILQQELSNQNKGEKLSAESSHEYGKSGEVAPEISGEIKKRRSDKKT